MSDLRRPKTAVTGVDEPLLDRTLRSELLRELSPSRAARARVRAGVATALIAGSASLAATKAEAAMAARATQLKAAGSVAGKVVALKSVAAKIIVSSVIVASGASVTTSIVQQRERTRRVPVAVTSAPASSPPVAAKKAAPQPSAQAEALPEQTRELAARAPAEPVAQASAIRPEPSRSAVVTSEPMPRHRAARTAVDTANASPARERVEPAPAALPEPATPTTASALPSASAPAAVVAEPVPAESTPAASTVAVRPTAVAAAAPPLPPTAAPKHLEAELSLVRSASSVLERGDTAGALALLANYERSYPRGSLATEAKALQVIALCRAKRPEAQAARQSFLNAHGNSALAQRVRSACP